MQHGNEAVILNRGVCHFHGRTRLRIATKEVEDETP